MPTVLVPWRGGCRHREAALSWVLGRYAALGWAVKLCEAPGGEWCKADAVIPALERAPADLVVVADADVWADGLERAAMAVVCGEAEWAIPHGGVFRLSEAATADVLAGAEPSEDAELTRPAYRGTEGGGVVIAHRDTLLDVPLDRRFRGWGQEDESWGVALRCLVGPPDRGRRPPLFHLWHPPQDRPATRWGSVESKRLHARYIAAREKPGVMRALIEEGL